MRPSVPLLVVLGLALPLPAARGQGPAFSSPGMPSGPGYGDLGQTTRFDNAFNPAIGLVLDGVASYTESDDRDLRGFDLDFRSLELSGAAYVDPRAWAYAVLVADADEVELDEAALEYIGFESNKTLKAGRFFVDFGKQMQIHEHDLRTIDRPLVLRAYLGEELPGNGVQFDDWFVAGETGAVRYSFAVFQSLQGEGEEDDDTVPSPFEDDLKNFDELAFTGRVTGFWDAGDHGQIQVGTSARLVPEFGFELDASGDQADGLQNAVVGIDVTYAHNDETATRRWTTGAEVLLLTGDVGADVDDQGTPGNPADDTILVIDDDALGFYVFVDRAWTRFQSAGLQIGWAELPETDLPEQVEVDLYYTRWLSDFHRLRFGVTWSDVEDGDDALRLAVQYTGYLGPHAHGVNW